MERIRAQPSSWERWGKFREENPAKAEAIIDTVARFYAKFTQIMAATPRRPLIELLESAEFAELLGALDEQTRRALGLPLNGKRISALRWATALAFALLTQAESGASK